MEAATTPVVPESSLISRMFNVLAAPGEVFEQIKDRPVSHANWMMPALLWAVIGSVLIIVMFSMETFQHEMKKQQEKGMQQQVQKGKMTQEQADQIMNNMPAWVMSLVKASMVVANFVYAFGIPFFWGFIIWLLCVNAFKVDLEFMKAVEAAGLASVIYALASLLGGLLSLAFGKITLLSPAFFIKDVDFSNRQHLMLAAINPLYIWFAIVVAVSISVLAGAPLKRTVPWCLGIWIAMRVLLLSNPYTMQFVM